VASVVNKEDLDANLDVKPVKKPKAVGAEPSKKAAMAPTPFLRRYLQAGAE
jgi:hypothetical protein